MTTTTTETVQELKGFKAALARGVWAMWNGEEPTVLVRLGVHAYGIARHKPNTLKRQARELLSFGAPAHVVAELLEAEEDDFPFVNPYIADMLDLHVAGVTPIEMEGTLPMSRAWVYQQLDKRGLDPNTTTAKELTSQVRQRILRMVDKGHSYSKIAKRLGISPHQVRYTVRRYGK